LTVRDRYIYLSACENKSDQNQ